jgi:hypothetical protein
MKIRLLCFAMSNLLSFSGSCQQITKDDITGIWDAITTNPNSPNVSIQFIDSFFVLTVGAQKGKSLYRLDDSSIPFILTTYESGSTNKLDYEIKFSGKDTLVFITIKGVDQKTLEHY